MLNYVLLCCVSGLGKLANLSNDYVTAVRAVDKLDELARAAEAVPFVADSPMGSSAPGQVGQVWWSDLMLTQKS